MKPIVVVDRDAFFEEDRLGTYYTEAEKLDLERYAQGRAERMDKEGYLVVAVKPGARVAVLWPPVPDVGKTRDSSPARPPLLIFDANSGIEGATRQGLEDAGYMTLGVKPGSRVVLL